MPLTAGARLGPYEIMSAIGAGGMGEVYRARDPRLARDVAIKVLSSTVAVDPDRLARFEQEARAAAALNHPNILAVFDIGRAGDPARPHPEAHPDRPEIVYIVSELLEGETLRAALSSALPLRKAIEFATQIAYGLAAAHEKGIVHRDLKPENIFITRDQRVKILDFGLAKLVEPTAPGGMSVLPTTPIATAAGLIVGTVGYMSPEQVRGQPTDHRTDIFSFGAVLYEMLSGQRAFRRETAAESLTAILKEDPPELSETGRQLPPGVERFVRRCLEKDPASRFQSAKDLAFALESLTGAGASSATAAATVGPSRRRALVALLAVAVAVVATALVTWTLASRRQAGPPSFTQVSFGRGYVRTARFAPDGQTIVYGAAWDGKAFRLFTTRTDSRESVAVNTPNADLLAVSRQAELAVAVRRRNEEALVPLSTLGRLALGGGQPREVVADVIDADWSPDGSALAVARRVANTFQLEYPAGSVLYETSGYISDLRVSPNGERVGFMDHPILGDDRGFVVVVDRQKTRRVLAGEFETEHGLAWTPNGDEIWFTGDNTLFAVSLSGRLRTVYRAPTRITLHDIAGDGTTLLGVDRLRGEVFGAETAGPAPPRELTPLEYATVSDLARDGTQALLNEYITGNYDVLVRGTDGSPPVRIATGIATSLSPNGRSAAVIRLDADQQLLLVPVGVGETRQVTAGPVHFREVWWAEKDRLIVRGFESGHRERTYVLDRNGGAQPITPEGVVPRSVSPDGSRIIAVAPDDSVLEYTVGGGEPRRVAGLQAGERPLRWTTAGAEFFAANMSEFPSAVFRINPETGARTLVATIPPPEGGGAISPTSIVVTPDGRRFAYCFVRVLSTMQVVKGLR